MPTTKRNTPAKSDASLSRPQAARQLAFDALEGQAAATPAASTSTPPAVDVELLASRVAGLLRRQEQPTPGRSGTSPDTPGPPMANSAANEPDQDPPEQLPATWTDYLREQRLVNSNYSRRDQKELRTLLLTCERPPPPASADLRFLRDRLRLYLVVAHRGWASALSALPDWELQQLGISPPAPRRHSCC